MHAQKRKPRESVSVESESENENETDCFRLCHFTDVLTQRCNDDDKQPQVKEGGVQNRFDKIDAGDYVTFKQVIVPLVAGPVLIPSSVVTYSEDKQGGKKISVVGSADGFQVLTVSSLSFSLSLF